MRASATLSPPAQGLYDPAHEHDACGVGFVAHIKGRRSHAIVRQALQVLINLQHRGACGCEANTGDGAGILIQMPDRFLRREAARLGLDAAGRAAATAPGWSSCRATRTPRGASSGCSSGSSPRKGSGCSAGATCRPTTARSGRARSRSSRCSGRSSIGRGPGWPRRRVGRGRRGVRAQAVRDPQADRARGRRAAISPDAQFFYVVSLSSRTLIYKGMLTADQIDGDVPGSGGPGRSSRRWRSCTSGSAPTRSRRGRWRIRTATSRTTARSTRCAATSTG